MIDSHRTVDAGKLSTQQSTGKMVGWVSWFGTRSICSAMRIMGWWLWLPIGNALDGTNARVVWLISRRFMTERCWLVVGLSLDDGTKLGMECYKEP